MFEWRTASNAIYLGEDEGGKGRQFKARFLVPGLVKYDYGVCLLTKENADKFINGFTGCPVVINHQTVTDENVKDVAVGDIFSVWFDEKDGYYWCNGILRDKEAIKLIDEGYSVSCQYLITEYSDNTSGKLHNGNPYDKIIENGKPEHLAIVNNPRYEGAIIAVNAIMAQNEDKWITIKPNGEEGKGKHLLLKDGESPKEAIERQYGNGGQMALGFPGAKKAQKDAKSYENKKIASRDKLYSIYMNDDLKGYNEKLVEALIEYNKYNNDGVNMDNLDAFVEKYEKQRDEEKTKTQYKKYVKEQSQKQSDTKDEGKETKKYNWKDKEYTLEELIHEGFEPIKYSGSIFKDDKLTYIEKEEGKKIYKLPVSDEDYKKANEYKKTRENNKVNKAKEQSKDLTDYIKWQYNQDIEPHITGRIGDKTLVYWNKLPRETQSALKRLDFDNKINLEQYSASEMSIGVKDKTIFENLKKHKTASNDLITTDELFVTEFKDTLYTALAEGIVNRLGEFLAQNKSNNSKEKWITIKGNHILLKDGESIVDAFKRVTGVSLTKGNNYSPKDTHKASKEYIETLERVKSDNNKNISTNDIFNSAVKNLELDADKLKSKIEEAEAYNDGILETQKKYSDGNGMYKRDRAEYHKEIIKDIFKNAENARPAKGEKPTFMILGGRGGSGKSKFDGLVYDKSKYIVLDADAIKEMLPEYKGYNAFEVHEESSDILKQALSKAKKEGLNVVLDGTMKTLSSTERKINTFKDAGYNIEMYYMHLPREKAAERALGRFMGAGGRYVPLEVLLDMKNNEENFDKLKHYASKWAFYNNDVPKKEDDPILVDKNY